MKKPEVSKKDRPIRLVGTVEALNSSPEGFTEGALVRTKKKLVQVNFARAHEGAVPEGFDVGREVSVRALLESDEGEHPVYKLEGEGERVFRGRIARRNFARHGACNGFQLEDGTFVHLKPEGAARVKPVVGEMVEVTGVRKASKGPVVVVERARVERVGA